MSMKEKNRRTMCRFIMRKAWKIFKTTVISFGMALKIAWRLLRGKLRSIKTKVRGVTFDNRQKVLESMTIIKANAYSVRLDRDSNNPYDRNAVAVVVRFVNKTEYIIGYLKRELAEQVAPLIDEGHRIYVVPIEVTGSRNQNYGCNIELFVL